MRFINSSLLLWLCCASVLNAQQERTPALELIPRLSCSETIQGLVETAIQEKKMPGCVICFGRHDRILHLSAYGNRALEPVTEPMTVDTVFDMASITKPVATGSSIMKLVEIGKLRINDKVVDILPEFSSKEKDKLTVLDLLVHRSGLIPDNALADYQNGVEKSWDRICDLPLTAPIGTAFKYSDVNFIVLGKIVEKLSGQDLNAFSRKNIFEPIGMQESGFLPGENLRKRAAPTEQRDGSWIQGEVHDPRAHLMNGVAGHAGLFSTAKDMALYAQMFLRMGKAVKADGSSVQVFAPTTLQLMSQGVPVPGGIRGLSWDKRTGFSTNKGDLLSESAVGHGGFTGTVLWMDPAQDLFFVFLSNRVHPNGKGLVNPLAGKILNVIASSLAEKPITEPTTYSTLTGLDVLQRDGFRVLDGANVGLITNHTGRSRSGASVVELLASAKNLQLKALFSPEHGFEGKLDIAKVNDSRDSKTGLKIYSLYGETRKPTAAMLSEIDTVVFDIQDIGTRFYTYISTMGEALKAAAENKKRFVILDRPNPINGVDVAGPMLDDKSESFVTYHKLPVRHGMTVGEIALMLRDELKLDVRLDIISCEGWKRSQSWDSTGLLWINPSPNMRSMKQALIYPGVGLLEMTNISVGRGTDTPFEWFGAPWIDNLKLSNWLNEQRLPGVAFVPVEFTPTSSKFEKQLCKGIQIDVLDRSKFETVRTGLTIALGLRTLHSDAWETKNLNRLMGCKAMEQAILDGADWGYLQTIYLAGMADFMKRRESHLLYR
jgi:uncharacterized protein YbbC (DUF1343 family)